jgi:hypothetical protein
MMKINGKTADAGLMMVTNGKTTDVGLTFLRHSDISAFLFFIIVKNARKNSLRALMLSILFFLLSYC